MESYSHAQSEGRFISQSDAVTSSCTQSGSLVPDAPAGKSLHYDISQVLNKTQLGLIQSTGIMAFHCLGDTGEDHAHGVFGKTTQVANMMEAESKPGNADSPCFCYHLGDVIYPGGEEARYPEEFYKPYSGYYNAILPIPGNHDYYGDQLKSFANNFLQAKLSHNGTTRPPMNLPWYYWVLDTPVATIIGLGAVANNLSPAQRQWFNAEVAAASTSKALIVAVHYPPYSFDLSSNCAIQTAIDDAAKAPGGRVPDLVISGHAHNYQRIAVSATAARKGYTSIVAGAGGVTLTPVHPSGTVPGATLMAHNTSNYGALTLTIDSKNKVIQGNYNVVDANGAPMTPSFDTFSINY